MRPEPTRRRSTRGGRGSGFEVDTAERCNIIRRGTSTGRYDDLETRDESRAVGEYLVSRFYFEILLHLCHRSVSRRCLYWTSRSPLSCNCTAFAQAVQIEALVWRPAFGRRHPSSYACTEGPSLVPVRSAAVPIKRLAAPPRAHRVALRTTGPTPQKTAAACPAEFVAAGGRRRRRRLDRPRPTVLWPCAAAQSTSSLQQQQLVQSSSS